MSSVALGRFSPDEHAALVSSWLHRAHVARWWGDPAQVFAELAAREVGTVALILEVGRPVGLICWQELSREEREAAGLLDLPPGLIDVDIMIGEENALGRGIGPRALQVLFARLKSEGVRAVSIATALENERALAAYAKVGVLPFREFVEGGRRYRYFTRRLDDWHGAGHA